MRALTLSKEPDLASARACGVILDGGLARTALLGVVLLSAGALLSKVTTDANGATAVLLHVAMTRAEDMLVILHSGPSGYIDELNSSCDARSEAELG